MRYAAVSCPKCGRQRMIDKVSASSGCPYCNAVCGHSGLNILFEDDDQSTVRDALARMHPFDRTEKKRPAADIDPLSTLIHRYESCSDIQEKMELISKGLTCICGTFTLDDLKKVDEKNADKMLRAMLELCIIHEVRYGRYSV
ncbi:MAG: hypothetical protein LBJ20_03545 [Candidatus Methanoplasma sp.]|jgi:hypothetical protein|nr:hypothetical protein [Candidatus Methanoplasma sp.]